MGKKQNAFGGAVGGDVAPAGTVPRQQPGRRQQRQGSGGRGQNKIANGSHSDASNPYSTGESGDITSGEGSFVANENPDDYWTWINAKAGLNLNPLTPFGAWDAKQNDFYQSLFGAYKLDHPSAYFSNFLGGYGFGSPTVPDPTGDGHGRGAPSNQTGAPGGQTSGPDQTGAGDRTGGKKHKGNGKGGRR